MIWQKLGSYISKLGCAGVSWTETIHFGLCVWSIALEKHVDLSDSEKQTNLLKQSMRQHCLEYGRKSQKIWTKAVHHLRRITVVTDQFSAQNTERQDEKGFAYNFPWFRHVSELWRPVPWIAENYTRKKTLRNLWVYTFSLQIANPAHCIKSIPRSRNCILKAPHTDLDRNT